MAGFSVAPMDTAGLDFELTPAHHPCRLDLHVTCTILNHPYLPPCLSLYNESYMGSHDIAISGSVLLSINSLLHWLLILTEWGA